jgi:ribose 5-phosphate isomerase B
MKIFIGADHNGFGPKKQLTEYLVRAKYDVEDIGDKSFDPEDDFPVFASTAVHKVLGSEDKDARAILICGSGQGMAMAANRFRGIRAGLGWSVSAAKSTRIDENSNVLALPSELFEGDAHKAYVVVEAWLNTPFAGATRYLRRNKELDNLTH